MPDFNKLTPEAIKEAIDKLLKGPNPSPSSTTYDLVYEGARIPPKVVIREAFKIIGDDVKYRDFDGGENTPAFNRLKELGFVIKKKNDVDISETLKLFVKDVKNKSQTSDTRTWYYPKKFGNYAFKASFGQGGFAKRPWLAITKDGQEIQNGIYPVYLYYRAQNKIVLAYGVSENNQPNYEWNLSDDIISIKEEVGFDDSITRCGFVHSVYKIDNHQLPNNVDFQVDLENILNDYENLVIETELDIAETLEFESPKEIYKNTILYGPPGTGKTFNTVNYVQEILGDKSVNPSIKSLKALYPGRLEFVTFHQSFSYEDFIEGLRATSDDDGNLTYEVTNGVFKNICEKAIPGKPSVMVIDEINRGNIARIFGELITLIEDTKRKGQQEELEVTLPYSKQSFSVPNEIFIVATMNTADRSLVMLDTALRRRFNFVEIAPNPSLLTNIDNVDCGKVLTVLNQRIEQLFDKEHAIGHSFFMKCKNIEDLMTTFDKRILPLLEEYFFDDFSKLSPILNGHFYERVSVDSSWAGEEINVDESKLIKRKDIFENPKIFSDALKDLYE